MAIKKATTTDDIVEAKPEPASKGSVKVTSPMGAVSEVPESIVDALVESGYKVEK